MGEKEKAIELVEKYISVNGNSFFSKECALIAVDEVISACEHNYVEDRNTYWWNRVKDEINKL